MMKVESAYSMNGPQLLKLYESIIDGKIRSEDLEEYCIIAISGFVSYNDYLHANNIMQVYRSRLSTKEANEIPPPWFDYYSILIYCQRMPKYYLEKPDLFWDRLKRINGEFDTDKLDFLIMKMLKLFLREYEKNIEGIQPLLKSFVKYYTEHHRNYSDAIQTSMEELVEVCSFGIEDTKKKLDNVMLNHNVLIKEENDSEEIENTITDNRDVPRPDKKIEFSKEVQAKFMKIHKIDKDGNHIQLPVGRHNRIVILGDSRVQERDIIGIVKDFGYTKDQIEFYLDYEKLTNMNVGKFQYDDKCMGIIVGPSPHSAKGNGNYSSIVTRLQQEAGFPFVALAEANGQLKITKSSLKEALENIAIHHITAKY